MKKSSLFAITVVAILAASCSKTNRTANRFEGEEWHVTTISIDGVELPADQLPEWHFEDCDHHKEICEAHWELGSEHAEFVWQINDGAKKFTISNQSDGDHDHDHEDDHDDHDDEDDHDDHDHGAEGAVAQCTELSGEYNIVISTRKNFEVESTTTVGHAGEKVRIVLEKHD